MTTNVLFDPGFAPLVYSFSENIKAIETLMSGIKIPNQRKFKFQSLQPQITALVNNSAAFYKGCLMWAKYIKETAPKSEIKNNPFYGINLKEQNITEEDFYYDINLFIEYIKKYPKNCQFYLGKQLNFPENILEIATTYKEFLTLNKSFTDTKYAADIKLPENINDIVQNSNEKNKELIDNAISSRKLELLLSN